MKIKYVQREEKKVEEEVKLPVYSQDSSDHGDSYHRLYELDGRLFVDSIYIRNDIDFEITTKHFRDNDLYINGQYYLGRGEYECTEAEWIKAVECTTAFLNHMGQ